MLSEKYEVMIVMMTVMIVILLGIILTCIFFGVRNIWQSVLSYTF